MQNIKQQAFAQDQVGVSRHSAVISTTVQLVAAFVLGGLIVYGAGFVNTAAVHNAAHDTRHSQGFPCH